MCIYAHFESLGDSLELSMEEFVAARAPTSKNPPMKISRMFSLLVKIVKWPIVWLSFLWQTLLVLLSDVSLYSFSCPVFYILHAIYIYCQLVDLFYLEVTLTYCNFCSLQVMLRQPSLYLKDLKVYSLVSISFTYEFDHCSLSLYLFTWGTTYSDVAVTWSFRWNRASQHWPCHIRGHQT